MRGAVVYLYVSVIFGEVVLFSEIWHEEEYPVAAVSRDEFVVAFGVEHCGQAYLSEVAEAYGGVGAFSCLCEGWHQDGKQQCDY